MSKCSIPRGKPQRVIPEDADSRASRDMQESVARTARKVDAILMAGTDAPIPDGKADKEHIFLMFAAFGGDIFRCAHACGVQPEEVTVLAEQGKWMERIRALIELKKNGSGPDLERGISRATNFVQANRYRLIIDRFLRRWEAMSDDELVNEFVTEYKNKAGHVTHTTVSFKLLADMATAMEKTHWLTYQATLDAPQDRVGRREKVKDEEVEEDVHAKIAKAMAGMVERTPTQQLQLAQDSQVAAVADNLKRAQEPAPPTPAPG